MKKEKRAYSVEFRTEARGDKRVLTGTPIVYNRDSENMGFIERVSPGAAKEALKKSDARVLYGHNSDTLLPLARMSAGTVAVKEDKAGVHIEVDPPDTQFARDLMTAIDRGDVQDMSFGFTVSDDSWETKDGMDYRTINKFDEIFDFSFVAYPAYQDTTAAMRSLEDHKRAIATNDLSGAIAKEMDDLEIFETEISISVGGL